MLKKEDDNRDIALTGFCAAELRAVICLTAYSYGRAY